MGNFPQESADVVEDIKPGAEAALAEAIGNLDVVDSTSVAGLLNQYLDVKISSRSSHSWDPNGTIGTNLDAKVSNAGASQSDIKSGSQSALAEAIGNYAASAGSVAAILSTIEGNNDLTALDAGGVDWSSKTPGGTNQSITLSVQYGSRQTAYSVSGSGYLTGADIVNTSSLNDNSIVHITLDGTDVISVRENGSAYPQPVLGAILRFNSSLEVVYENLTGSGSNDISAEVSLSYALD